MLFSNSSRSCDAVHTGRAEGACIRTRGLCSVCSVRYGTVRYACAVRGSRRSRVFCSVRFPATPPARQSEHGVYTCFSRGLYLLRKSIFRFSYVRPYVSVLYVPVFLDQRKNLVRVCGLHMRTPYENFVREQSSGTWATAIYTRVVPGTWLFFDDEEYVLTRSTGNCSQYHYCCCCLMRVGV